MERPAILFYLSISSHFTFSSLSFPLLQYFLISSAHWPLQQTLQRVAPLHLTPACWILFSSTIPDSFHWSQYLTLILLLFAPIGHFNFHQIQYCAWLISVCILFPIVFSRAFLKSSHNVGLCPSSGLWLFGDWRWWLPGFKRVIIYACKQTSSMAEPQATVMLRLPSCGVLVILTCHCASVAMPIHFNLASGPTQLHH